MRGNIVALTEISTFSDFIIWVEQIRSESTTGIKSTCFFRGHADLKWQLLPGVYRSVQDNNSFRTDESRLYHEMLRLDPAAFAQDNTPFERLVRMQHYGLPTRLLDITENYLVALFFACLEEPAKDGQVMAFPLPDRRSVMHQQDLPPTSMVGVDRELDFSQLDRQLINSFYTFVSNEKKLVESSSSDHPQFNARFMEYVNGIEKLHPNIVSQISDPLDSFGYIRYIVEISHQFCTNTIEWLKLEENSATNSSNLESQIFLNEMSLRLLKWERNAITLLCDQMGIPDQGAKQRLADFLNSLMHFNFIVPSLNNKRIRQQSGAFIVCSPIPSKCWTLEKACESMGCTVVTVLIKAKAKGGLLKALAEIGITRHSLFPELAEQAKYIQTIYPPSPDKFLTPI